MDLKQPIAKWRKDPTLFVKTVLNAKPDKWQSGVMQAVANGDRGVSIRSGHGVGKTSCLSWLALWWISCHYHAKVVITAPTSAQLHDALLPEAKAWLKQSPEGYKEMFTVRADRIELANDPERNFISARTSRAEQPDALQGIHAEHVLLICDEASGVPEQVYEAAGGSMSALHSCMVLAGNPVRSSGYFYDTFHKLNDRWNTFHVSCEESERVSGLYRRMPYKIRRRVERLSGSSSWRISDLRRRHRDLDGVDRRCDQQGCHADSIFAICVGRGRCTVRGGRICTL